MIQRHPVQIGELTELVTLHRRTLTSDGMGGQTASLNQYAQVWAHIRPATGKESELAMRTDASRGYLVVIRNRSDIQEGDIVRWAGRDLNIRFLRDRGNRPLYLELEADYGVPA